MPATYVEVALEASGEVLDQLVALLGRLGFEGFWEDGIALKCYINELRWSPELQRNVEEVARMVQRSCRTSDPLLAIARLEDIDWNAEWEKTIQPIRVGQRIVIAPSWNPHTPEPGDLVLTIDPKMSFGTGYHETTRLSLRLLENSVRPGDSMLDIGTGTGVLAIAALKLGASQAVGVDIDEWSEMNAQENARVNDVSDRLTILRGTLADVPAGQFDIVAANIQRSVLVPIMGDMVQRLKSSAHLLLSGLLVGDEEEIRQTARAAGAAVLSRESENEWIALSLQLT
jgi:ribosomal protein L11 methyltransferase